MDLDETPRFSCLDLRDQGPPVINSNFQFIVRSILFLDGTLNHRIIDRQLVESSPGTVDLNPPSLRSDISREISRVGYLYPDPVCGDYDGGAYESVPGFLGG